jgi:hypothetical protein
MTEEANEVTELRARIARVEAAIEAARKERAAAPRAPRAPALFVGVVAFALTGSVVYAARWSAPPPRKAPSAPASVAASDERSDQGDSPETERIALREDICRFQTKESGRKLAGCESTLATLRATPAASSAPSPCRCAPGRVDAGCRCP